jgi:hypothetical protein
MVATPVANINGASLESLIDQNYAALRAVTAAIDALAIAAPHGRDFQTLAPEVFRIAVREHSERVVMLGKIERELMEIVANLADQRK